MDPGGRIGRALRNAADRVWDQVPELRLTSDVPVPVYLIHHGPGAEDYEILCDFQQFMAENQTGMLSRPVLQIWAGRADFARPQFARHLRQAFSDQFEALRDAHARDQARWHLPGIADVVLWVLSLAGNVASGVLLYLATQGARSAVHQINQAIRGSMLGRLARGKSAEQRLEDLIDEKKDVIDAALAQIEITLHRDLYAHAWHGQRPGPMTGMDRNAWPLPDFVRERMTD